MENVHLINEGHDYGPSKRAAMYRFMAKHLSLNLKAVESQDGNIDESETTVDEGSLRVFTLEHPRSDYALTNSSAVAEALVRAKK